MGYDKNMKKFHLRPREQRLKEIIIGQGIVSLIIIGISIYLVFSGFGYKINWQNLSIKHTGIIQLAFWPKDAEIFINSESKQKSSPYYLSLFPGYYQIEIKKDGYMPWSQDIKIEPDKVVSYRNIVLFKREPEISSVSDKNTIASIDAPYDILVKNPQGDLKSNEYEIWNGDDLVTRFSEKISGVIWYPGREYIGFQQNDEIRIIAKNGTYDNLLVKLSSDAPTKFLFSWDGSSLLYRDGSEYKKADIN